MVNNQYGYQVRTETEDTNNTIGDDMKFQRYVTEDYEQVREYKKAIFDLEVALGEKEYAEGEKPDKDAERRRRQKEFMVNIKMRIITLKEKIQKMSTELGESIDPKLQEVLDKIPNKEDVDPNYKKPETEDKE